MTSATDLFRGCSASLTLPGGAAPARFSSGLAHSARSHQPLSFASSWIQGFLHSVPSLGGGTAYGELLGPLADSLLHPHSIQPVRGAQQRSPARAAPALPRRHSAGARDEGRALHDSTGEGTASATMRTATSQTKAVAGSSARIGRPGGSANSSPQWARMGAGTGASTGAISSTAAAMTYRQSGSTGLAPIFRATAAAVSLPRSGGSGQAASLSLRAIREWQQRLAERVRARLILRGGNENKKFGAAPARDLWCQLVDGPTASTELLMGAGTTRVMSANSEVFSAARAPGSSTAAVLIPSPVPVETLAVPAGKSLNLTAETPALFPIPISALEQSTVATLREVGEELLSNAAGQTCTPLLLPSAHAATQAPCGPPPASLTRTAILPLYEQEFESGDELTWLSQKMKRVLDEEARRHGIKI